MSKKELGSWGESIAMDYLVEKGYHLLACNYHCRQGEIDVIVCKADFIIFVEVKTISSLVYGSPLYKIDRSKQAKIRHTARRYLAENPTWYEHSIRFDVITIVLGGQTWKLNHLENAF